MHACAHEICDVEDFMQSIHVHTRGVLNNLHKHACMSVIYTLNLVRIHVDVYNYQYAKDDVINYSI